MYLDIARTLDSCQLLTAEIKPRRFCSSCRKIWKTQNMLSPCSSVFFSFRCSKQGEKNYSGFRQPVVVRLGRLRRHVTHAHLDAWPEGKQLKRNHAQSRCYHF